MEAMAERIQSSFSWYKNRLYIVPTWVYSKAVACLALFNVRHAVIQIGENSLASHNQSENNPSSARSMKKQSITDRAGILPAGRNPLAPNRTEESKMNTGELSAAKMEMSAGAADDLAGVRRQDEAVESHAGSSSSNEGSEAGVEATDQFSQSLDDFLERRKKWLDEDSEDYQRADAARVRALRAMRGLVK